MGTNEPPAIGMNIGTTYSSVAVYQYGKVHIINSDQGENKIPTYITYTESERLIGHEAKSLFSLHSKNSIFWFKGLIGKKMDEIHSHLPKMPFQIIEYDGKLKIGVTFKKEKLFFTLEEVTAMIIRKLKFIAEEYLCQDVKDAVIAVPTVFGDTQRQAVLDAATIAGLNVIRLVSEPAASAVMYKQLKNVQGDRIQLIFDLGANYGNVLIVKIVKGALLQVLAMTGSDKMGGIYFDNCIVDYFRKIFQIKHRIDLRSNSSSIFRLQNAIEEAKKRLSIITDTSIEIFALYNNINFFTILSRLQLEILCSDIFKTILIPIKTALQDAKLNKDSINEVILTGKSCKIPKIQKIMRDFFGEKCKLFIDDESVAGGAAIQAAILKGVENKNLKKSFLLEVAPLTLYLETDDGIVRLIERNTPIPFKMDKLFAKDNHRINFENFHIFEEKTLEAEIKCTKICDLDEITEDPEEKADIYITFDIDYNGILRISAKYLDPANTKSVNITILKNTLSIDEINQMKEQCIEGEKFDLIQKEKKFARHSLEVYVFSAKKATKKDDKLSEEEKYFVNSIYENTFLWLEKNPLINSRQLFKRMKKVELLISPIIEKIDVHLELVYPSLERWIIKTMAVADSPCTTQRILSELHTDPHLSEPRFQHVQEFDSDELEQRLNSLERRGIVIKRDDAFLLVKDKESNSEKQGGKKCYIQ